MWHKKSYRLRTCTKNPTGLEHAQKIYDIDKDFLETHEEIIETGVSTAIKSLTKMLIGIFAALVVLFGILLAFFNYRYGEGSKYYVTGDRLTQNKQLIKQYLDEGDYFRAYTLASFTDPTQEYFTYYPEYKDELYAIFTYRNIFSGVNLSLEDMDDGEAPRPLDPSDLITLHIFYELPDNEVKAKLELELDNYLRNLYCLTDEEIDLLKSLEDTNDFTLDGSYDIRQITKERMRARHEY